MAKKWVRELYETVPDCVARVVSSITDIDRMYELYRHTDKTLFMVLSKESARNGYLRKPAVTLNERRNGFVCPVCGAVQQMTVSRDGFSYAVPADSLYFKEENAKNHKKDLAGKTLWYYHTDGNGKTVRKERREINGRRNSAETVLLGERLGR